MNDDRLQSTLRQLFSEFPETRPWQVVELASGRANDSLSACWQQYPSVSVTRIGQGGSSALPTNVVVQRQEAVEQLPSQEPTVDLLVLDGWEVGTSDYKSLHRQAYESVRHMLKTNSLILINRTDVDHGGKGEEAVPVIEKDGFFLVFSDEVTLLARGELAAHLPNLPLPPSLPSFDCLGLEQAVELQKRGLTWQAQRIYERILANDPRNAGALHLLGLVHHQRGQFTKALEWIAKAILVDPRNSVFFNNYGAAHQCLGNWIEAVGSYTAAVGVRPSYFDAWRNLGIAWETLGSPAESERCFQRALELDAANQDIVVRLARLQCRHGRRQEALEGLERAISLIDSPELYRELGDVLVHDRKSAQAVKAYRESLRRNPDQAIVHYNLSAALQDLDEIDQAKSHVQIACRLAPQNSSWRLREMLLCPTVFESADQIDEYRGGLDRQLDELIANPPPVKPEELVNIGFYPPFQLSFQGREHRPLKEKFAALFRHWIKPLDVKPKGSRPRIGFVVTRGHEGQFLRCMAGLADRLDRSKLEVVICCSESNAARLRQGLQSPETEYVVFAETLKSARERIAQAACHVLYYWEIGTDALNYTLPCYRLAPVQVTAWGTQVTTGMKEVDFYLSSDLIEQADAQRHYTERLHLFSSLPTYQRRLPLPSPKPRAAFGLPEDRPVYLCPQTVLKLHPEQDLLFKQLLDADPGGVLAIKLGRHGKANETVVRRMKRSLGNCFGQIVFVPWQEDRDDFMRLIAQADVVLDTLYFSAGSTTYDIFSLDQPIVTLPGTWNIGRYTLACYRAMGLLDLVAGTAEDYVQKAVRMANDRKWRAHTRSSLRDKTPRLFEDQQCVAEHQAFFLEQAAGLH